MNGFLQWLFEHEPSLVAIASATVGAIAAHQLHRRKEKQSARRELVSDAGAFFYDWLGLLIEAYNEIASLQKQDGTTYPMKLAELERYFGQYAKLEIRIWRWFSDAQILASLSRLRHRFKQTQDMILKIEKIPQRNVVDLGIKWCKGQISETVELMAKETGLNLRRKSRYAFVGFRRVTREDRQKCSPSPEVPPWDFCISCEHECIAISENTGDELCRDIEQEFKDKRCPKHGGVLHIVLTRRRSGDLSLELTGCCKEFVSSLQHQIQKSVCKSKPSNRIQRTLPRH